MIKTLALLAALIATGASAQIPGNMRGGAYDMRLRTLDYDPSAVVRLEGCLNFQTMVTFSEREHIENVGLGDSSQWQVMPNKRGNLLFVKPITVKALSNMTVVTDKRSYVFELRTAPQTDCVHGRVVYDLHFRYPDDKPDTPAGTPVAGAPKADNGLPLPEKRNSAYTYSGEAGLVPMRVFDDGTSTYMKWAIGIETPAVYALGPDNTESLVNYANRGDYMVVEQVARAFVLRRGKQTVTLYNDAFRLQGLDELSPKPHGRGGK